MGTSFRHARVAVLVVATALVAAMLQPTIAAVSAQPAEESDREVLSLRTETSKTFRNDDGSLTTRAFSGPVHFREGGEWKPIDSDLVAADAPGYGYRNAAAAFHALFKEELDEGFMRFVAGGRTFDFSIDAAARAASNRSKSGIAYREAYPGVDVSYDIVPDGVKETLVLDGPAAPSHYRFYLDTTDSDSLMVEELPNGAWAFQERTEEEPLFVLDPPYAIDANHERFELPPATAPDPEPPPSPSPSPSPAPEGSPGASPEPPAASDAPGASPDAVDTSPSPEASPAPSPGQADTPAPEPAFTEETDGHGRNRQAPQDAPGGPRRPEDTHATMKVSRVGKRFAIDLTVDAAWLHDTERAFPVLVDPSITIQPSLREANFNASCPTCLPAGWGDLMYIGTTDKDAWRDALQFDLGDIPAGAAQVGNAKLKLYYEDCIPALAGCRDRSHQIDVHRMTSAWSTVTTTQELGFDATPLASYTLPVGADYGWMTWDLTTTVKNWLSGTQNNFGLLVKRNPDATLGQGGPRVPGGAYTQEPTIRPALEVTWNADAVTLAEPGTLHSNGAELSWTPYAGASAFTSYEVHRSATSRFTPGPSTMLATIGTKTTTTYRDTTAAPSRSFTYKIVTNGNVSNERTVTLPANGQATKMLQAGPAVTKATYVTKDTGYTVCDNNGARDKLYVGSESTSVRRPIVQFDLGEIPASASVTNAKLSLWRLGQTSFGATINAHRVTSAWQEGAGVGGCTRDGATWYSATGTVAWASQGGDYDPVVATSVTHSGHGAAAGWDNFNLTGLVGDWVRGKAPNHGVLFKLSDETLAAGRSYSYWSDDVSVSPTLQPRLVLQYSEPVSAQGPTVTISSPGDQAQVKGSVNLVAAASDDRRVDKVEFLIDGSLVATDTSAPFEAAWASTSVANGTHTLTARATDDAGNTATSPAVTLNVGNSNPPTVAITAPGGGTNVTGTTALSANATDDVSISKVEFLADGLHIGGPVTTSPYSVSWNTLDPALPFYDGSHEITAKAYDGHGNVTTSAPVSVNVTNTAGSKFKATITATSPVPQAMTYDPAKTTQDVHGITVSITNTSGVTWDTSDVVGRYRWISPTGPVSHGQFALGSSFRSGTTRTQTINVPPPTLPAGTDKAAYTLRFDLYSVSSAAWFADKGNKPSDHPVLVNKAIEATALGLERYYHYEGEPAGAGMTHLTNVASGNALLRWSPFYSPGRGLSTMVDLTYNSLEDDSDSPIGNNFSLGISSLTRFGLPLDIHPNNADTLAGRSNKYIELTDSDGTTHRFTANANGGWDEPAGVHLYLREYSTTDTQRKWALTKPDRVTFFYDTEGFPTSVEDKNGNRIAFTWETIPAGEDPGGVKRRITKVTDAAGLGASPAPNRSFTIDYYSKAEAKKPQVRGKVEKIIDHTGSALVFDYYDDGNLLRLTQKGGTNADGSFLADRSFVFTYTTPDGSAAAIPLASDRLDPATKTNQSSRIYSVRDPRGNETTFTYYGPTSSQLRWKLQSRTNRRGKTTSFAYDLTNRLTTVTAPISRVTKFAYDTQGKVTGITNPKNETTTVAWTTDRHVSKVTEPTGKYTEFAYNSNGYVTDMWDQLRNRTTLEYENIAVDANDVSTKWKSGRTIPHISQLKTKTDPKGTATASPTDDFQYTFVYDVKGNLAKVLEPEGSPAFETTYAYNPDGTLQSVTNARLNPTTFSGYDPNGLATTITDAKGQITKLGFDDDGLLRWIQDPRHSALTGGDSRTYRTHFDYDSFHRLGRQSTPKLTTLAGAMPLIWSAVAYDPNDNVEAEYAPAEGHQYVPGPKTTMTYNPGDQLDSSTNPENHKTVIGYDDAGRLTSVTSPKGVATSNVKSDFATSFVYDELDRVKREMTFDGEIGKWLITHHCYDPAGDLVSTTSPRADLTTVDCAATTTPPFTTKLDYDDAHRLIMVEDPLGRQSKQSYDPNGNVDTVTDALNETTQLFYDERNLLTKVVEPFDGTRSITTRYEYNEVGNLSKLISPRAHDSGLDSLAKKYVYDQVDQVTRIDLPYKGTDTRTSVYRRYDKSGNVEATTAPIPILDPPPATEQQLWESISDKMETHVSYFDTGLPRTIDDHINAVTAYDYNARGQQIRRDVLGEEERWTYYDDGMLHLHYDREDAHVEHKYDENDNLVWAKDTSGVDRHDDNAIKIEVSYDKVDRVAKVRHRKEKGETEPYDFTTYAYDLNGNVVERKENGVESADGATILTPAKRHTFTYDAADWLQTQHDYLTTGCQKIENEFNAVGLEAVRKVSKAAQACDASPQFTVKQTTVWDYFKNRLPKKQRTMNGNVDTTTAHDPIAPAVVIEKHELGYLEGAVYVNGHKTSDSFFRHRPTAGQCDTVSDGCVARYTYDGRDRLVKEDRGHAAPGAVTDYQLNAAGNVTAKTTNGVTTNYFYDGVQLDYASAGGVTSNHIYEPDGKLDCVVTSNSMTSCPTAQQPTGMLKDYSWDGLGRLKDVETFVPTTGAKTDDATYSYDALDRVIEQAETHGIGTGSEKNRKTTFTFLGLTNLVTKESFSGTDALSDSKTYTYDAYDTRISMVDDPAGTAAPKTYTYGYDAHGSVSTLLDDSNSTVKASYGYDAYGARDGTLTDGDDVNGRETDPLNPYRYTGRRLDTGSGTLDMGARRFGPDSQTFLQPDYYRGALANLGLSMDPLTGSRYALAGGNPVSFVEADGHKPLLDPGPSKPPDGPPAGDRRLVEAGSSSGEVDQEVWDGLIRKAEPHGVSGQLQPQCYADYIPAQEARGLAAQCFEQILGPATLNRAFWDMWGVGYHTDWEPPTEGDRRLVDALSWLTPGTGPLKALKGTVKGIRAAASGVKKFYGFVRGLVRGKGGSAATTRTAFRALPEDEALRIADHAIEGGHLSGIPGISSADELAQYADDIVANTPDELVRQLQQGRTAYWDSSRNVVLIRDPASPHGGTIFSPSRGYDYFLDLR
jgi:RHS repeat-associated protein